MSLDRFWALIGGLGIQTLFVARALSPLHAYDVCLAGRPQRDEVERAARLVEGLELVSFVEVSEVYRDVLVVFIRRDVPPAGT